ncbi:extracellular calcium-sensing receptor-like [Nematolebias whitei]|uniref:extracellular calcium-sensing receptor-like n=1 Tax=Nematolebias whitei TaxID=451745 RepID=UPI00189BC0A7|nr:extracellular calcium-sensing receptor-like [Nematolebias whitei]
MRLMEVMTIVLGDSLDDVNENTMPIKSLTTTDVSTQASSLKCTLQIPPRLPAFSVNGDFIIGGVFCLHYESESVIYNYTTNPETLQCTGSPTARELRFSRTLIFAIEEINNSTKLLPGIKLGYQIYDSCASVPVSVHVAFQLSNGHDPVFYKGSNCSHSGVVMAVVGDSGSTQSISLSRLIGSFNIPQVSHFATCACLSDKQQYPTFFRTIPSDQFQADALVKLVKHYGWTWIGAVRSDSDYGNYGMTTFLNAAQKEGICVEYSESLYRTDSSTKIQRVADVIRRSTANVVVAFLDSADMRVLLEELAQEFSPPRQWIGSEGWITDSYLMSFSFCAGAVGVAIQKSVIPGLRDFLLDLSPTEVAASSLLTEFWEDAFNCSLNKKSSVHLDAVPYKKICDGNEDIKTLKSPYTETTQLRVTNMVYKAVYAIAHAIHNAVCEKTNLTTLCKKQAGLESKQILSELKIVNFSHNGYPVSFDTNGDPVAFYELVNWQKSDSGVIELVTIGYYDASLPKGQEFLINRNITWVEGSLQVPVSVCSESCPPGTHKVLQKGKPICCYDCIPCPEGEISNNTDSPDCFPCPRELWPNEEKDHCFLKLVEFLSFDEVLSIILAAFSAFGACLAIITGIIFFHHRTTPIVRANNSELSFLLLFSLTLCFLCSLTFIGAPSEWSCMLRHTAFGIIFVLCISCVLGKTVVVLMAFKATLPGSNVMKWFGHPQQRLTVVSLTFIQILICTVWLVLSPPFPMKNLTTYKNKIILECALGSAVGFWWYLDIGKNGLKEKNELIEDLTGAGVSTEALSIKCTLQGTPRVPAFSMDGDFVIGGVFSIHYKPLTVINNYTTKPDPARCTGSIIGRELRFSSAMIFAIEEINNNSKLLPGIKLGYQIYDSCAAVPVAIQVAFQLSNGHTPVFYKDNNCSQFGVVKAIVGESGSTPSISMSRIFGSFHIPQVSHSATCACLSDKKQYPTFFRTTPSDQFQADALAKLVKTFGWTWIGAVHSDSDYGNYGMASFLDAAQREGICVEYSESFYRTDSRYKIKRVADAIRRSTAIIVVAFTATGDIRVLLEELAREPPPPRQWIGSEDWITDPYLMSFSFCAGAIGVTIQQSVIPGLRDFLLDLSPTEVAASSILTEFWEDAFNCSLTKGLISTDSGQYKSVCDGNENIKMLQNPYTDTSQLRVTNMVYKAVYAIAHAIHNAMCQRTNLTTQCYNNIRLESKKVLSELKNVNFSQNGYSVSFDVNGDPVPFYELVNWQKSESGGFKVVTVGYYDASQIKGQEFHINKNITWMEGGTKVPVSVCSESCPPGTHKVLQKGKPICCYDCIPCPEGEISNTTDSPDCIPCSGEFWTNEKRDACFQKPVEFLSFDEVLSIILAAFSLCGACLAIMTAAIFFRHRTTPIVRANNSELSFLLLFSLTLCFLCSLTFIGAPSEWSCMLRHTAFGITFVLCISCVLGKTVVVLMAFKATLPGSNVMKWFGPPQQRMTVVFFTFIQVLICTLWLVLSPPFPMKNLTTYKEKIILECALGSAVGFWAVLGYIGLLAVFCFVLAVLARKLPDNFNEARMITFSMLIFCAVWITFIPAYISSPGKFTVAVEIFAILASSFGLILCIFAPKCFIILFQSEKNSKKYLMNKN